MDRWGHAPFQLFIPQLAGPESWPVSTPGLEHLEADDFSFPCTFPAEICLKKVFRCLPDGLPDGLLRINISRASSSIYLGATQWWGGR